jgi:hypothetical protein
MRLVALLVIAGCQKDLVAELPDAALDAGIDALASACPTPAQPLAPGKHEVYLNTEGVTLMKCAADDATTNCTTLITNDVVAVPAFLPGMTGRTDAIAQIVAMVQAKLAPYSVDIVTTRPTSVDYQMVVLGGSYLLAGQTSPNVTGLTPSNCAFAARAVDYMFDEGLDQGTLVYADAMVDDLGVLMGLAPANAAGDCMCRLDASCTGSPPADCTFGVNVLTTTDTLFDCGRTTQDEPALLKTAVGCR